MGVKPPRLRDICPWLLYLALPEGGLNFLSPDMATAPVVAPGSGQESVAEFWHKHCANMNEENRAKGAEIAAILENDWGIADAAGMSALYLHEITGVIQAAGASERWAVGVEHKLAAGFKRQSTAVPPSACLVQSTKPVLTEKAKESSGSYKLGPQLLMHNAFAQLKMDEAELDACIFLTENADRNQTPLHKDEKSNVLQYIYNWRLKHKSMGRDHLLFKRVLLPVLQRKFPKVKGAPWERSLSIHASNRSRKNVEVGSARGE